MTYRFGSLFALGLLVLAGACETSPFAPGEGRVSLEEALAELDVPALRPATGTFTGIGPPPVIVPSACPFEAASESFACPPIKAGGLTLNESFTLVSAAGVRQSAFNGRTTSWLRVATSIRGTVAVGGYTHTVDGEQELIIAGLLTDRHTINGSSSKQVLTVTDGSPGAQPVASTVTTKFKNVVLPVKPPGSPVAWPLSGSMEIQTTEYADYPPPYPGPGPMVGGVVVVFTGTSHVEVAFTSRGVTRACITDMAQVLGCQF
jgi:hypothetical protein